MSIFNSKSFPGVMPPDPHSAGRGAGGREGKGCVMAVGGWTPLCVYVCVHSNWQTID